MKKIFLLLNLVCAIAITSISPVFASHSYVNGYYKSNGSYVNGYNRTAPNYTKLDNFSTKGNINPYTYKKGTVDPYNYTKKGIKRNTFGN